MLAFRQQSAQAPPNRSDWREQGESLIERHLDECIGDLSLIERTAMRQVHPICQTSRFYVQVDLSLLISKHSMTGPPHSAECRITHPPREGLFSRKPLAR
jgi:hypothetical protein